VVLDGEQVALIERTRGAELYYVLPDGTVDEGESPERAAQRKAGEELGLDVEIGALVAEIIVTDSTDSSRQRYYLARVVEGTFGTGTGDEFGHGRDTYRAVWRPLDDCLVLDVRRRALVHAIVGHGPDRLARRPLRVSETRDG
jgi:8-oxo-dGTP pyrophosphatase MutT (NUDIX family)